MEVTLKLIEFLDNMLWLLFYLNFYCNLTTKEFFIIMLNIAGLYIQKE